MVGIGTLANGPERIVWYHHSPQYLTRMDSLILLNLTNISSLEIAEY